MLDLTDLNKKTETQIIKLNKGGYYTNEFWFSPAYQSLSKYARDLLQRVYTELRKNNQKIKSRGKREWVINNNGQIAFTEVQYKKLTGRSSQNYLDCRNQLIEKGIIKIVYRGGKGKGDMSKYKLLFVKGVPEGEQRWRRYPKHSWSIEIPTNKNQLIGKKTQWQKDESGRT